MTQPVPTTRKHAQWNPHENRIFIAACETVIANGHRNGKCFTKHGWDQLIRLFNSNSSHRWTKQQLKNHWDGLQMKHKRLMELIHSTGVEYISKTGYIAAFDDWWERKMKETLSFLSLRRNREILAMQEDANDKLDWVEWSWLEHRKAHPK
ncbi:Hypothetical predicted protein [Olea europaea subsp. europaea]|uniref:Myb/SANT-like domain-containing protein n=1 Tax=Olea europaea subsp. europaea TaxID=158383 RepID=A0A8S0RUM8_OLEEU|nr:Hypothetical predicted protein [Olea europaea subsp. europaea]